MHLFLHHILRYLLQRDLQQEAVIFARAYEKFVYFGHALEILLHTVLEEEAGHDLGDGKCFDMRTNLIYFFILLILNL
jgi:hypothetical protein